MSANDGNYKISVDGEVKGSPKAQTPSLSRKAYASNESIQSPQSSSSSVNVRQWRPAAQRNLRNQWSKLASLRRDWASSSSTARSHATYLVKFFLSRKYMDAMELSALSGMPNIRKKACLKVFKQQVLLCNNLLSSYKDMDDTGDGGGIPVFTFWPIYPFEKVAEDFVQMFISELNLKRLLVMELLSLDDVKGSEINRLQWSDEFYRRNFEELSACNLYLEEACKPVLPTLGKCKSETATEQPKHQQDRDVLQVYLTTWITEVNIDQSRVDEIFDVVGVQMHVTLT